MICPVVHDSGQLPLIVAAVGSIITATAALIVAVRRRPLPIDDGRETIE